MGDQRVLWGGAGGFDWEGAEDLITALCKAELWGGLEALVEEEGAVSDRRGIFFLRGRMDVTRAKLVRGGVAALVPEALARLARVLLGEGRAS
jgi:hypothetical protein